MNWSDILSKVVAGLIVAILPLFGAWLHKRWTQLRDFHVQNQVEILALKVQIEKLSSDLVESRAEISGQEKRHREKLETVEGLLGRLESRIDKMFRDALTKAIDKVQQQLDQERTKKEKEEGERSGR